MHVRGLSSTCRTVSCLRRTFLPENWTSTQGVRPKHDCEFTIFSMNMVPENRTKSWGASFPWEHLKHETVHVWYCCFHFTQIELVQTPRQVIQTSIFQCTAGSWLHQCTLQSNFQRNLFEGPDTRIVSVARRVEHQSCMLIPWLKTSELKKRITSVRPGLYWKVSQRSVFPAWNFWILWYYKT